LDADMANRRTRWGHYRDFISGFSGNKFDEIRKSVLIVTT
jgi:hypothetical protein